MSESSAEVRLAIPQSVRDVIARRLTHLSQECNRRAGARLRARPRVRPRRARPRDRRLGGRAARHARRGDGRSRRLRRSWCARVACASRTSSSATRSTRGSPTARRVRLHRLAVEALEALYGEEPGPAPRRARAPLPSPGATSTRASATPGAPATARSRSSPTRRPRVCTRRRSTRSTSPTAAARTRAASSCSRSARRRFARGTASAAKEAFLDAAEIARPLGLSRELARAAAGYGGRIVWVRAGADDRLVPLLEEGLAALADEDVELRARLLARLAGALRDEPSRDRRDALSREAVELARQTGNPTALAYALDGRAAAIARPRHGGGVPRARHRAPRGGRANRRRRAGRGRALSPDHGAASSRRHPWGGGRSRRGEPHRRRAQAACSALAGRRRQGDARAGAGQAHRGRGARPRRGRARRARAAIGGNPCLRAPAVHAVRLPGRPSPRSSRRSATWSPSIRLAPSSAARSPTSVPGSDGCRRRNERSMTWRGTTSRPSRSIRSGSTA